MLISYLRALVCCAEAAFLSTEAIGLFTYKPLGDVDDDDAAGGGTSSDADRLRRVLPSSWRPGARQDRQADANAVADGQAVQPVGPGSSGG